MRRKSIFWGAGVGLAVLGVVLSILAVLLRHEPTFYRRAVVPAGEERRKLCKDFQVQAAQLWFWLDQDRYGNSLASDTLMAKSKDGPDQPRSDAPEFSFSQDQINSYFEEDLTRSGVMDKMLPTSISAPRVWVEQDRITLGFRYGRGWWSTVMSVEMRAWLAAAEPNVLCLQIERLRAGWLPLSSQSVMDRFLEPLRRSGTEVTWYRLGNTPVAMLRFQHSRPNSSVQLRWLKLQPGMVTTGSSRDGKAALSTPGETPAGN